MGLLGVLAKIQLFIPDENANVLINASFLDKDSGFPDAHMGLRLRALLYCLLCFRLRRTSLSVLKLGWNSAIESCFPYSKSKPSSFGPGHIWLLGFRNLNPLCVNLASSSE